MRDRVGSDQGNKLKNYVNDQNTWAHNLTYTRTYVSFSDVFISFIPQNVDYAKEHLRSFVCEFHHFSKEFDKTQPLYVVSYS